MSKRKTLNRGKIKNPELLRGRGMGRGGSGGGGTTPKDGSWAEGVKPNRAFKLALKSTTSLTKVNGITFKGTVSAIKRNQRLVQKSTKATQANAQVKKTQQKAKQPVKNKANVKPLTKTSVLKRATTAVKKAVTKTIRKGMQMLKKMAKPAPKKARPAKTIKRSTPKR